MPPETLKALYEEGSAALKAAGCETPQLDARLLLQAAAAATREDLVLFPDRAVTDSDAARFRGHIARRLAHEPVSRILAVREFYGRNFHVSPAVLDPRPDTETLVGAALARMGREAHVLDLGTGSGAIIVTLLAERADVIGTATDISPEALVIARRNAEALGVSGRLRLVEGSWFAGLSELFDIIVSNPPYITESEFVTLAPEVRNFDPRLALVGGRDGLDPYRAIAGGAAASLKPGGHVLVEIGAGQAADVTAVFAAAGLRRVAAHRDLGGHVRCLDFAP